MKIRRILLSLLGVGMLATAAYAAGISTNGLPTIVPPTVNGVAQSAPLGLYTELGAVVPSIAVDTNLPSGQNPQSVAVSPFMIASHAAALTTNTATSTVHAATLNTVEGLVTTEALSTAPGTTYTFTLTNSLLTASTAAPQVLMLSGTNTGGAISLVSVTNGSGNSVFVFKNTGTTALNGTMLIAFHI